MCNKAAETGTYQLKDVSDWFVTQQQIDIWCDDYCCHDDEIIEWYEGYKKGRPKKPQEKKSSCLLPGTHQGTGIGACQKKRKKRQKNYGHKQETFSYLMTKYKKKLTQKGYR